MTDPERRKTAAATRDASYYVVLSANSKARICESDADRNRLTVSIIHHVLRDHARLHAYVVTDFDARFIVQVSDRPIGKIAHAITHDYRQQSGRLRNGTYKRISSHCDITLLTTPRTLLDVVRHIHRTPMDCGLATRTAPYLWSSHDIYLSERHAPWITTAHVLSLVSEDPANADIRYRELMASEEPAWYRAAPRQNSAVQGDKDFVSALQAERATSPVVVTIDQVVDAVCARLQVSKETVLSPSKHHMFALARTLIAWHVVENGIATRKRVAYRLNRSPMAMYQNLTRFRTQHPELFQETLGTLFSTTARGSEQRGGRAKKSPPHAAPTQSTDASLGAVISAGVGASSA